MGQRTVAISDYDGKTLGQLALKVEPLLKRYASHPGKLRTIGSALNPANHDDAIPSVDVLRVAMGDLVNLKKTYL